MNFSLVRYNSTPTSTLGALFVGQTPSEWLCFTLEDPHRDEKIAGETRIPAGKYPLALRNEGGLNERYYERYIARAGWHRGMIWVQDVPDFEWIYLHIGNRVSETEGCPLVGFDAQAPLEGIEDEWRVSRSRDAYEEIYPRIADAIEREPCTLHVLDLA